MLLAFHSSSYCHCSSHSSSYSLALLPLLLLFPLLLPSRYASRHPPSDLAKRKPQDEFNWGCGRRWFYPIAGCEGTAAYAVAHMPASVEQIFSEVGCRSECLV